MAHPFHLAVTSSLILMFLAAWASVARAQENLPPVEKLPVVKELPDPFLFSDGSRVKSKEDWARRRAELEAQIMYYEYGRMPPAPGNTKAVLLVSSDYKLMKDVSHRV